MNILNFGGEMMKLKTIAEKEFEVSEENLRRIAKGKYDICRFMSCQFCKYADTKNKTCTKTNKDTYVNIEELAKLLQIANTYRKRG